MKTEPNLIVVGSVASVLNCVLRNNRRTINECKDIDIIVSSTTNLEKVYDLNYYEGKGYYSDTTKRASMTLDNVFIIRTTVKG